MKWIDIVGAKVVVKKLEHFKREVEDGKIPFLLAGDLRALIEKRSKSGQGLQGGFKDYSTAPYYREIGLRPKGMGGRRKNKRNGKPLKTIAYDQGYKQFAALTKGANTPDLIASGSMFRAFQPMQVSKSTAQLFFNRQREAYKALINNARRPFIGATRRERKILNGAFADLLNILLRRVKLT